MTQAELILQMAHELVEQGRRVNEVRSELSELKRQNMESDLKMMSLPEPIIKAPDKPTRQNVVDFINKIAWRDGKQQINLWRMLYKEYKLSTGVDIRDGAKKHNMNKAQFAEKFGHIDALYALAIKLYL